MTPIGGSMKLGKLAMAALASVLMMGSLILVPRPAQAQAPDLAGLLNAITGLLGGTPPAVLAPNPPPTPAANRCPLTGVEAPAGIDLNRPAIGIKIDNHPRARPPAGLESADMVYEELVEGGLTRFLAIFHCGDAASLGPTRSVRAVDPDLLVQYAPVLFAYSGGSPNNLRKVASTPGVIDLKHGSNAAAYSRVGGRSAPHNLFTSTDRIRALPGAQGVVGPPRTGLIFGPSPAGTGANRVSISYSGGSGSMVSYTYDPTTNRYLRSIGGRPHNEVSGGQLSAVNVLVLKVSVNRSGSSPEITVTGSGEATVLREGRVIQGRWNRSGLADQMTLTDASGQPIQLAPGNVWINMLPSDRPMTLE